MDPVTAITLVQAGIGVAQMLQGGDASIGTLLALQASMLKKISEQITLVQHSINLLFSEVDQLKLLVRKLPSSTVIELFRAQMVGAINEYKETMRTFDRDRKNKGIKFANDQNLEEFRAITSKTRTARDVLMGYHEETTIPIVACALQTEIHCMIMQAIRDSRIEEALVTYKEWFDNWLNPGFEGNLIGEMAETETQAKKLLESRQAESPKYLGFFCFDSEVRFVGATITRVSGTRQKLLTFEEADDGLVQIHNEARTANESGAGIPNLFFDLRKENVGFSSDRILAEGNAAQATLNELSNGVQPYKHFWPGFTGICKSSQATLADINARKKAENEAITLARLRLLSLGGFRVAALNCQSFCSKLLADLGAN